VVVLLARLARVSSPRDDMVLVGAVAVVGRGLLTALLAHLSMRPTGWVAWQQAVVLAAIAVLTGGLVDDLLRHGPQVRGRVPVEPVQQRVP
jgi:hypothetical protein